jgi:pyridoxal 5'-phosphate synthase pdxT subunit
MVINRKLKVGVLAAQGAFIEHIHTLQHLDVDAVQVRLPEQIEGLDGLIIPGGESTTISKLILAYDLENVLQSRVRAGMPVFGTCAGMIMLARDVVDGKGVHSLRLMDITVRRNAFGRQVDSFETDLKIDAVAFEPIHAIFIRAPLIEKVGEGVEVLSRLDDGTIVAARQGNMLVSSFHPELTDDTRFHRYFLSLMSGG